MWLHWNWILFDKAQRRFIKFSPGNQWNCISVGVSGDFGGHKLSRVGKFARCGKYDWAMDVRTILAWIHVLGLLHVKDQAITSTNVCHQKEVGVGFLQPSSYVRWLVDAWVTGCNLVVEIPNHRSTQMDISSKPSAKIRRLCMTIRNILSTWWFLSSFCLVCLSWHAENPNPPTRPCGFFLFISFYPSSKGRGFW